VSPSELEALEHDALEHLAEEEGHVEADLEEAAALASVPEEEPERSPLRLAVAMPPAVHYASPCEQCGYTDDGPSEWCA